MLLIADSGSTKADWVLSDGRTKLIEFNTLGINPTFHDKPFIIGELLKQKEANGCFDKVKIIRFFGAGCSSDSRSNIVKEALQEVFPNAAIYVDHDMLGAAIAACGNEKGLVCILGTGSNIAYWSGSELSETRHGMGYILGDEASGTYFGKKLISSYLYQTMPEDLRIPFFNEFNTDKEDVIENVYHKPNANVFLAKHARFLSMYAEHPYVLQLISNGFQEFFDTNIVAWTQYKSCPVHFIGSIAFHFRDILAQSADKNNYIIGKIIVKPVDELFNYYADSQ